MAELSIIVTTYNIENYVADCLDSIISQSFEDIEIIVVDDGSSDGTVDIINGYAERDSRIVFVPLTENTIGGVATAANVGLDRATAPLVGFADGDDLYEPTMFERLVVAIESSDADLAMCKYALLDDVSGERSEPADARRWDALGSSAVDLTDDDARIEILRFIAVPWRKLYRRELLDRHDIRFPVGDYFWEDNPFHWFTVCAAERLALVPEVLCAHRINRAGQTMQSGDARLVKMFDHHDSILAFLEAAELRGRFDRELLLWSISQLEWISRSLPAEYRSLLLDRFAEVLGVYTPADVERAFEASTKGQRARDLVAAARSRDADAFDAAIDGAPSPTSTPTATTTRLVGRFGHHLQNGGPSQALAVTRRYVSLRASGAKKRVLGKRGTKKTVTNDDLMFSMLLLERRLEDLEQRIIDLGTPGGRE
ncbi:MAG: glycosyltransferase [Actinomycetota bacterium]